jgi:hypothetical protein
MDLGGSTNSFSFDHPGAKVEGTVIEVGEQQQTDLDTGEPAFWQSGQPKMLIKVVLQTELKDSPTDDGKRSIYLKGSRKPESKSSLAAVIGALMAATGGTELEPGGKLSLEYVGDGEKTNRAFNAPKQYRATYAAPSVNLGGPPPPTVQEPETSPAQSAPLRPSEAVSSPSGPSGVQGATPGPASPQGPIIGWLNGQAITPAIEAAFKAIGNNPRTMAGFVPAGDQPPF